MNNDDRKLKEVEPHGLSRANDRLATARPKLDPNLPIVLSARNHPAGLLLQHAHSVREHAKGNDVMGVILNRCKS